MINTNTTFMKKIPKGAEASNIMVGEVDFLKKPISAFIRLEVTFLFPVIIKDIILLSY